MITTLEDYTNNQYSTTLSSLYDGVVRVSSNGYYGTGVLLQDGRTVLTAAHIFNTNSQEANVYFDTLYNDVIQGYVMMHYDYETIHNNNDIAMIFLSENAPKFAPRHDIYRQNNELGQLFTMVGYGIPGYGQIGEDVNYDSNYVRLKTQNIFESDFSAIKDVLGNYMVWNPLENSQLAADFDNNTLEHDALGQFLNISQTGIGFMEGIISSGDSGGPAFIDNKIAGIASYVSSLENSFFQPDVDEYINSSFGEIASWQRVSFYQEWIDEMLREHYINVPMQSQEVKKVIQEGNSTISYTYFLVEFTGVRLNENQLLSVDYTTKNGTAIEYEDYLPISGTLILYPNENSAVIPVEIIPDFVLEEDETFYLEISNPIGGSFGEDVLTLSAMRTIENDDLIA